MDDDSVAYHRGSRGAQIASGFIGQFLRPCFSVNDILNSLRADPVHARQLVPSMHPSPPVAPDFFGLIHIENYTPIMDESLLSVAILDVSRIISQVKMLWVATPPRPRTFMKYAKWVRVLSGFKKIRDSVGERVFVSFSTGDYTKKAISVLGGISCPRPALIRPILDHVRPENLNLLRSYNRHWLAIFGGHTGVL